MALFEVKNIIKSFGKAEVLKDISFEQEEGSVLSIIGSSGSGKTTLLRDIIRQKSEKYEETVKAFWRRYD